MSEFSILSQNWFVISFKDEIKPIHSLGKNNRPPG